MAKTAIILPCYNQAERADALVDYIRSHTKMGYDLYLLDNGGTNTPRNTTHRVEKNLGTGGGIYYLLDKARNKGYVYYWLLSTSLQFEPSTDDPLRRLIVSLEAYQAAAVAPGWTGKIENYPHKYNRFTGIEHETPMLNTMALWDAEWWESVGGFERKLTTGWGSDYELCWKARNDGKKLIVSGSVAMEITEGATYQTDEERQEYMRQASNELYSVMTEKYGEAWEATLMEGVDAPVCV